MNGELEGIQRTDVKGRQPSYRWNFLKTELELINNVVLVSGARQSDSVVYVHWNS